MAGRAHEGTPRPGSGGARCSSRSPSTGCSAEARAQAFAGQRVLLVTPELSATGGPKSLLDVARTLRDAGAVVVLATLADGPLRGAFEAAGVEVAACERRRLGGLPLAGRVLQLAALARIARRARPTAVLANTAHAFAGVWLARLARVPAVWCLRESLPPDDARVRATLALRPRVVFVAEATRAAWRLPGGDVLPNGVDRAAVDAVRAGDARARLRARLGVGEGASCIALVGTTCERKGQHVLLEAAGRLQAERPGRAPHFLLVGARPGPYLERLHGLARAAPRPERIHLEPECPDALPWLAAADLACCPSFVESHPRVVLEAMAFGLPVVASEVFGIPEQIDAGRSGLLVPPGDAAALAAAIGRLLDDKALAARLGAAARADYEARFSADTSLRRWRALFAELWGLSPRSAAASGGAR